MSTAAIREEFLGLIRRDLLGPAGGDREAVTEEKVRDRYLLGVLAPVKQTDELPSLEEMDELAEDGDDSPEEGMPEPSTPAATRNMTPSSFGMSFCLAAEASSLIIEARWG